MEEKRTDIVDSAEPQDELSLAFPPALLPEVGIENERRDAAEHRRHILQVARQLFNEQGVDQVSMHQIAQAAQVGQGTLYRRFAHKGILCAVLLQESVISFQSELLTYYQQAEGDISVPEQIYHTMLQVISFTEENSPFLGAIADASSGEKRAQFYQSPFYLWLRQVISVLLKRGIVARQLPAQDIAYVVDVILGTLTIDFYHYQRHELGMSQQRIAAGLRQFLFTGLGPGASA